MLKMQKHYAQNAETLCSKCRNIMFKMRKHYAQSTETLCSKFKNVMLKMWNGHAQNAEMLMLKIQKSYAQKQISVIRYTVRGQALIRELT